MEKIKGTLTAVGIAQTCHARVTGIEHKILVILALIHEYMVYTHLFEVHNRIPVLFHLILDGGNLGGKILLALDKTFQHGA